MSDKQAFVVHNDGAALIETNYWTSDLARAGKFMLSTNAGTIRLLIPVSMEGLIEDMKTGKTVVLTRGPYNGVDSVEMLFDDDSDDPFSVQIDARQADRLWPRTDDGRRVPFVVYTVGCKVAWATECWLRRAGRLPCLIPWQA